MFKKALLGGAAVAALSLGTMGTSFAAQDVNARIDALQHELRALQAQMQTRDAKIAELEKSTEGLGDLPKFNGKKLQISSRDGQYSIRFGGRIMLDGTLYDYDMGPGGDISDHGAEFRRLRFFAAGKIAGDWKYKLQLDFDGDDGDHKIDLKDVYIRYAGFDGVDITAGHFKAPQGLEELTSSKYITFIERTPMSNALMPSRQLGLAFKHSGDNYGVSGGYFFQGDSVLGDDGAAYDSDNNEGMTARAWFAPMAGKTRAVHLGLGGSLRNNGDNNFDLEIQPNNHNAPKLIDGNVPAANWDDFTSFTPEAAVVFGPFSAQAEYTWGELSGKGGAGDVDVEAGYVMASWFVTGESRPYDAGDGDFGRVKSEGALELAARYDYTDFSDSNITNGGEATNVTLGANYYFNPYVRLMGNYVYTEAEPNGGADIDGNAFITRIQVDF